MELRKDFVKEIVELIKADKDITDNRVKEVFKSLCKVDGISTKFYFDVAIQQGKKWTIYQSYNGETKVFDSSKKWVDWLAENA